MQGSAFFPVRPAPPACAHCHRLIGPTSRAEAACMHCGAPIDASALRTGQETSPLTEPVPWEAPPWLSDPTWGADEAAKKPTPESGWTMSDDSATAAPAAGTTEVWGSADVEVSDEAVVKVKRKREMPPAVVLGGLGLAAALLLYTFLSATVLGKTKLAPPVVRSCQVFVAYEGSHPTGEAVRSLQAMEDTWYGANVKVFQAKAASDKTFAKAANDMQYLSDAFKSGSPSAADVAAHKKSITDACASVTS